MKYLIFLTFVKNNMKILSALVFLLFTSINYAQVHEVSGGNIGISLNGGLIMNTPTGAGYGFGGGLTTGFGEVLFPEVSYQFQKETYGLDSLGAEQSAQSNNLGLGLNSKIPIFHFKLGKSSKGECWWLNFKLLIDYKYAWMLSNKANFNFNKANNHGFNFGLGLRPSYSGGHKSRVAWSYFYDVYYHLDLNKNDQLALQETNWKQNGVYFRITILHHTTSDFLKTGIDKKKAYKRKY